MLSQNRILTAPLDYRNALPRLSQPHTGKKHTHFHELLLCPYLNGLHLLRSLSLNTIRVEENLKAKEHREKRERDFETMHLLAWKMPGGGEKGRGSAKSKHIFNVCQQYAVCIAIQSCSGVSPYVRGELLGLAQRVSTDLGNPHHLFVFISQNCTPGNSGTDQGL